MLIGFLATLPLLFTTADFPLSEDVNAVKQHDNRCVMYVKQSSSVHTHTEQRQVSPLVTESASCHHQQTANYVEESAPNHYTVHTEVSQVTANLRWLVKTGK